MEIIDIVKFVLVVGGINILAWIVTEIGVSTILARGLNNIIEKRLGK